MMIAQRSDISENIQHFFNAVFKGEPMLVPRKGENAVVLTQSEYDDLAKSKRNAEYISKIERGFDEIARGKGIEKTMAELEEMAK